VNVEKIARKKLSSIVAEQIEKMIETGTFKAGEKLPSMRELCEMFDVGRSAVRDALITLHAKGIVYVKQGEGTFICDFDSANMFKKSGLLPNQKTIYELFQVRKILEAGLAEQAAFHRTLEDLNTMEETLSSTLGGWESDYQFHMAIARATGNEIIFQLMEFISSTTKKTMNEFHIKIKKDKQAVALINAQHMKIFESIQLGDSQKAKEQMIKHLSYVEQLLQEGVEEHTHV
jgi:GntR family transcriptional repressor for pyruvate dehydrogenase complex